MYLLWGREKLFLKGRKKPTNIYWYKKFKFYMHDKLYFKVIVK